MISYFDVVHSNHDQVKSFLEKLDNTCDVTFYTTVTTKSEFLDYQRKRYLTCGIISLVQEFKDKVDVSPKSSAKIHNTLAQRNLRLKREEAKEIELEDFNSSVNYFTDIELKEIKKTFRARDIEKETGWLKICEKFLGKRLMAQEERIDEFCTYLTTRDKSQKDIFIVDEVDWKEATALSAKTGMGYSDSMILNMALATNVENIVTLDFDIIYAGAISAANKNIVMPDHRIKSFKQILKHPHI